MFADKLTQTRFPHQNGNNIPGFHHEKRLRTVQFGLMLSDKFGPFRNPPRL